MLEQPLLRWLLELEQRVAREHVCVTSVISMIERTSMFVKQNTSRATGSPNPN